MPLFLPRIGTPQGSLGPGTSSTEGERGSEKLAPAESLRDPITFPRHGRDRAPICLGEVMPGDRGCRGGSGAAGGGRAETSGVEWGDEAGEARGGVTLGRRAGSVRYRRTRHVSGSVGWVTSEGTEVIRPLFATPSLFGTPQVR
jgi:hypothetical protein